jgi:hypothetical protein
MVDTTKIFLNKLMNTCEILVFVSIKLKVTDETDIFKSNKDLFLVLKGDIEVMDLRR